MDKRIVRRQVDVFIHHKLILEAFMKKRCKQFRRRVFRREKTVGKRKILFMFPLSDDRIQQCCEPALFRFDDLPCLRQVPARDFAGDFLRIMLSLRCSPGVTKVMAVPLFPARPVRPIR